MIVAAALLCTDANSDRKSERLQRVDLERMIVRPGPGREQPREFRRMLSGQTSREQAADERLDLRVIDLVETLVHYLVAILLLVITARVLWHAVADLVSDRHDFAEQMIRGINDILLVVILMELLRTVVAHLETHDFQLRSFLVIGIISGVRHILAVGAQLTVMAHLSSSDFKRAQIAVAVSAEVVLALAIGFLLIHRLPADARSV